MRITHDARQQPGETLMSSRTSGTNELRRRLGCRRPARGPAVEHRSLSG